MEFLAHPQISEQVSALKAFMQALKMKFEVTNVENYAPSSVEKIVESREQAKSGKVTRVKEENLKEFPGL